MTSRTAFSPTDPTIKWTHCHVFEIQQWLLTTYELRIYAVCIRRCLKRLGYVQRKPSKNIATGKSPFRAEQFLVLLTLSNFFESRKDVPILSIDTKKKELVGNLTRNQPIWMAKGDKMSVFDHDYTNLATEKAVPHGIYDIKRNEGYITIGNSAETADFVVENLEYWWTTYGIHLYPDTNQILVFCDGGGANNYRHYRFKYCMQELAKSIGKTCIICHYPPYCSKYNPIEHRLFAQIHRQMKGTHFMTIEQLADCIKETKTATGLKVFVRINRKEYKTGLESSPQLLDENHFRPAIKLPQFSYAFIP